MNPMIFIPIFICINRLILHHTKDNDKFVFTVAAALIALYVSVAIVWSIA